MLMVLLQAQFWQYLHEICPQVNISYDTFWKQHGLRRYFSLIRLKEMKVPPDLVMSRCW